jgi:Zn-dependent M16 (insulinase) family peptidase
MKTMKTLASDLQKALMKIGIANGTAMPPSQDPIDQYLHDFYVASIGRRFFEGQHDKTKKAMLDALDDKEKQEIEDLVKQTKDNKMGDSMDLTAGQNYSLVVSTRKGSLKLDDDKLRVALQVKHGMSAATVDKLFASCSDTTEPAKVFTVNPIRDN